jgi:hypothetical protein
VDFFVLNTSPNLKKDLRSIRENSEPEIHERVDFNGPSMSLRPMARGGWCSARGVALFRRIEA